MATSSTVPGSMAGTGNAPSDTVPARRPGRLSGTLRPSGWPAWRSCMLTSSATRTHAIRPPWRMRWPGVQAAAVRVRELAAGHDAKVRELAARARVLGAGGSAPGGPRAEHGHVAYGGPALVTAGAVTLRAVGDEAGHLPAVWAAHDDPRLDLVPVPALVIRRQARRPGHVLRTRAGAVLTTDDIRPFGQQLAAGDVTELSPGEVDQYMSGRQ